MHTYIYTHTLPCFDGHHRKLHPFQVWTQRLQLPQRWSQEEARVEADVEAAGTGPGSMVFFHNQLIRINSLYIVFT